MDSKFKKILVGVDDSPDAILAFEYAISRAKEDDAELTIVSVLEDEDFNVYQALSKDYVHGKIEDLRKHVLGYKEKARKGR
ncbi:hypothetical protein Q757_03975 [Oenococcus alcoholitolerans]|uniref:UspA domain-containing protein n=1 Tax=Oenococcus alcoholitolerans TaxID=931074 RepID=A0ABR4XR58_9LACO|nr:hypothetical protein Q757_03975 [Oenococcus alcoholitolerans]